MTEQHAQNEREEPVPPSDAASEGRADATPPGAGGQAASVPLGEWRGPAFWMACGALVAGLVGGAVVLAQRVAVERDMMAVAATLPQATATGATQAAGQPPAVIAPEVAPAPSIGQQPAASPPSGHARPARRHVARRPAATPAPRTVDAPRVKTAKTRVKLSAAARRNRTEIEARYAEVFQRCPPLGARGAIQCRQDICNGAEGKGPACKPYVRKLP